MPSENSAIIFFDRALNRGRRTESRVLFGYFLHDAKSDNSFPLQRTSRFCKPRFSSSQWRFRTNKIKTFPKESFEVLQTSNQRTKLHLPTNKIKSFCRFAAFAPPSAALSVAAATTFVASRLFLRLRRFFRRLRRLCNFPMESSSLPGRHAPRAFSAACGGTSRRPCRQKGHQT